MVKVLHSFSDEHNIIWKEIFYCQVLSAILARKHYGSIDFFTTPDIAKQIDSINLPIDLYENIDTNTVQSKDKTWSVPKLRTYSAQQEPFLHIDNDTFLFNKIKFEDFNQPILFSHPDMNIKKNKPSLSDGISNIIQTMNVDVNLINNHYSRLNETYLRLYFEILYKGSQSNLITDNFDLGSIPNMNITYVEDYDLFSDAVDRALQHYTDNRLLIDNAMYGPCYIEQLSIHQILRTIDGSYAESSSAGKHFIFKDVPTLLIGSENYTPDINDVVWPLVFKTINLCGRCNTNHKDKLVFQSEVALKSFLDNDFGGFMHATYMKWYDWMQAIILDNIRVRVGDQTLLAIHSYFRDVYPSYDLPVKSGGEKLYEKLTKFSFD